MASRVMMIQYLSMKGIANNPWSSSEGDDMVNHKNDVGDTQETVHPGLPEQRILQSPQPNQRQQCIGCGGPAEMNASLGPSCPDCYDNLSG